ncbi:MAG: hypothetical protein EOO73_10850 [Myxococcales bacterium]|nr:MAG: hypothetical protein EOO73_10850 [Myxococcales bacterium]
MARRSPYCLLLSLLCAAPPVWAAEPVGDKFPDAEAPLGVLPTSEDALIDPKMARSWGALPPRAFAATTVDFGFVYIRPRLSLGYGRPFTQWLGVDANPIAQTSGLGAYGGFRVEIPHVDWRIGGRYFSSFEHTFLVPQGSYDRIDFERKVSDKAKTLTWESELDLSFNLGPGRLLVRGSVSYVTGVPDGRYVFEETLHVIVDPPWVWRSRIAYGYVFGSRGQHSIGPAVDLLDVPGREDSRTVRVGPVLTMKLSRRVEVRGSFVFTVVSPDRIGLKGGDSTELGLRYRWASE